ncbi:MAG: Rid family hydrolase, partial [Gemmatimonadota bacterium]
MSRRVISTDDAPEAIGPYSQAILTAGWLYTAGQIGLDPETGEFVGEGVEEQARRALANLEAVLAEASLGFGDVVKTTVFLA